MTLPIKPRVAAGTSTKELHEKRVKSDQLAELRAKQPVDNRPLHERLTCVWGGRSLHKTSGEPTSWDNVQLEWKLVASAVVPPVGADGKSAPAKASSVGTLTGGGSSCWHSYVIPFSIAGEFDLTTRTAKIVKQHLDIKFNNAVHYQLKLVGPEDGTLGEMSLTSDEPNLTLRPIISALKPGGDIPDSDLCKICMERATNCIIIPCMHIAICMQCSVKLPACPICRGVVSEAKMFYKS